MNKFLGIGRLTKDVELATTNKGTNVAKFTVAIDRIKKAGEDKETDFLNVVAFSKLAENCNKYLKKGSLCCICGQVQNRSYEDKDKVKRYITEIIAEEIEFINSPNNSESKNEENSVEPAPMFKDIKKVDDEQLPF